jgi:16S rRNA processing protein RimM
MNDRLEVGRIGRAHGLKGEVHVVPITNHPERFTPGSSLFVGDREYVIDGARPHQQHWLVRFAGVDDRNAAEALRNQLVSAEPLGALPDGEFWVHELIGAEVRDKAGHVVGRVSSVEANPAHDLLVLEDGRLVPVVFVVSQADGVVVIEPPEGLLDL